MKKGSKIFVLAVMLLILSTLLHAGVEPSPFREGMKVTISRIIENLVKLQKSDQQLSEELLKQIDKIMEAVKSCDPYLIDDKDLMTAKQALDVLDRISGVLVHPDLLKSSVDLQKEGVNMMGKISYVMFTPQPEPPGVYYLDMTSTVIGIFDRISMVVISPKPEPPQAYIVANMLDIFDRIAVVGVNPQPEPSIASKDIIMIWSKAVELIYAKDLKTADRSLSLEMLNVIDLMTNLKAEVPVK